MRNNQERLNPTQFQQPQQPEQPQPQGVFSFAVPTEFVELPSKGKYYPEGHPLHMVKEVEIKHMTAKDEDILTSQSLLERGIALDRLLQNVLIDKRIDVRSLLRGDKDALLIACRRYGYGVDYHATSTCNECFEENECLFDIASWKVSEIMLDDKFNYQENANTFLTKLPKSGLNVEFKFLNSFEISKIEKTTEENKENNQLENYNSLFLSSIIVQVEGYSDAVSIGNFVEGVPAKDALYLRNLYSRIEPKISTRSKFLCSNCGHEEDVEVPLGVDFFWPNA